MNRIGWAVLGLMVLAGCKDKPAVALREAPEPATPEEAGWTLTLEKVDGYVRYQRALLYQAGKLVPPAFDGGRLKTFDPQSIEQKATADERARAEAGLSEEDVLKIEELVSAVASRRLTARLMGMSDQEPQPDLDATATPEQRAASAAQAAVRKAALELPEERKRFGDAAVDVLLKREEALLSNWALMLEVPELAEKRR